MVDPAPPQSRLLALLTPWRCRILFAVLVVYGFVDHVRYLYHNCPLDLSGDEAHYWDWSRQLGLSYYSKGPLAAYLIRLSTTFLGNTMPGVRMPALVLAMGTAFLTYWLMFRLFRSDRLALGSSLLGSIVPMFVAGSLLMTIDPPFFFCWAAASCLAVLAVFDDRRWAWPAIGIVIGVGFLAKYAMPLWLVGLLLFMLADPAGRRLLKSPWPWLILPVFALFTVPVLVWNMQNGWVSLRHVAHQTGAERGQFRIGNVIELLAGQVGVVGPSLAVILIGAIVYALRAPADHPHRRQLRFLLAMGLPFFLIVVLSSFRAKAQINWPAPAYFSLMLLAGYFLSVRLTRGAPHRWWWAGNFWGALIFGLIMVPVALNMEKIYPLIGWANAHFSKKRIQVRNIDPSYKLRGWAELGQHLGDDLATAAPNGFILCDDYQITAETAFYTPGQPKTYYAGSYYKRAKSRKRFSQYDMWPDRSLEPGKSTLIGRDALFVTDAPKRIPTTGPTSQPSLRADITSAFDSVEPLPAVQIWRSGQKLRTFNVWLCRNFHGMERPDDAKSAY